MQKGNENLIKFTLFFTIGLGIYLILAWASFSPLDNAWSIASSATQGVLNKTGALGAWLVDLQYSMFGKVGFIAPFVFTFSAAYVLVLKLVPRLNWHKLALWYASFALFMCGLAALASVILPNSPYYLSGGFIGGALQQLFGNGIGQILLLLVGMLFTSVGFYFCSGQVILQLFMQFYDWILHGKTENSESQSEGTESVLQTDNQPVVQIEPDDKPNFLKSLREYKQAQQIQKTMPSESEELNNNEQENIATDLTDLSRFRPSMPKITGLKSKETEIDEIVSHTDIDNAFTDIAKFKPHTPNMPKVRVEKTPAPVKDVALDNLDTDQNVALEPEETFEPPVMPTIRLNADIPSENKMRMNTTSAEQHKITEDVRIEPVSKIVTEGPEFMHQHNLKMKPLETSQEQSRLDILKDVAESEDNEIDDAHQASLTVSVQKSIQPEMEAPVLGVSKNETIYPKGGYGDSLIHPLLQKKQKIEKPTTPLPTLDLLTSHPAERQQITEQEIVEMSARIERELANFRVKATVEDVLVGPVVTRYEIQPANGTIASKVTRLENDLARTLMLPRIRITEVVPGKPYMGIEAPNRYRETVWLRDVLDSEEFIHSKHKLPMALGKDISGNPIVVDMTTMPHLLVAGQTGGGKSVGVNTMILSLLFKLTPEQVRFIMIDPKVVELSIYNDIPHLLTPVVTDMKKAENALRWAVEEMERRYLLLSSLSVRNIEGYNDKIRQADEEYGYPIPNPIWKPGDTMDTMPPPLEKMSYIVLVVDEFADLMMSAGKQVEDHIMRIAQKARAVGIHLILATQRPSTDVITGVIKANIPSRIAFTVASQIDSRTILDTGGAENLLGRGDMLYAANGNPDIIRIHGAFMSDDDVQRVADNWRARGRPDYIESIVASRDSDENGNTERGSDDVDPLFDEIAQFMIDGGATSISGIQRRFSLGFNRAARIIDQLEEQGILSAADSRGRREVLAK